MPQFSDIFFKFLSFRLIFIFIYLKSIKSVVYFLAGLENCTKWEQECVLFDCVREQQCRESVSRGSWTRERGKERVHADCKSSLANCVVFNLPAARQEQQQQQSTCMFILFWFFVVAIAVVVRVSEQAICERVCVCECFANYCHRLV